MNTITDCTCDYCGHDWKCELSVAQTMACPGCGDKPESKNTKPIFTQAMANKGILPSVGMECMVWLSTSSYKGTITYMGDGVGCYHSKDNDREYTFALTDIKFKAIDTRTDKQKAIAEILSYEPSTTFEGLLSDAYDKWVGK